MGRLIDDLLTFSRLGRQVLEPLPIDMHAVAQSVFDELAAIEPERKLRLELHPLPPARGTQSMVRQVWGEEAAYRRRLAADGQVQAALVAFGGARAMR